MTQEDNGLLRKSLDSVDRHRKRMFAAVVVVTILTTVAQFRLVQFSKAGDVSRTLVTAVVVLEFWTATWAAVVVFQLTRMTKMVLRAIELASKPPTA